jgi:hypothetical protein
MLSHIDLFLRSLLFPYLFLLIYYVQGETNVTAGVVFSGKSSGLTNDLVRISLFSLELVRSTRRIVTFVSTCT